MELSSSNIKKILIFSQKKAFLILSKTESCTFQSKHEKKNNPPGENFLYFRKQKTRKNLLMFLIFWEMEVLSPKNLQSLKLRYIFIIFFF